MFLSFQMPISSIMFHIISFHNYLWIFLISILIFVFINILHIIILGEKGRFYFKFISVTCLLIDLLCALFSFNSDLTRLVRFLNFKTLYSSTNVTHATLLELVWTLTPAFILFLIAIPSFILLYSFDEVLSPILSNKITGYQWFWGYEYPPSKIRLRTTLKANVINIEYFQDKILEYLSIEDDSSFITNYLKHDQIIIYKKTMVLSYLSNFPDQVPHKQYRLLETDTSFILPIHITVRLLITAADVLHSWAVPSLGIKMDAVPGRLNSINVRAMHEAVLYGQCSELCGVQHAQMPIRVLVVSLFEYHKYIKSLYNQNK